MPEHDHEIVESYYGYTCKVPGCDLFYAYGCAPWEDEDEEADADRASPTADFD